MKLLKTGINEVDPGELDNTGETEKVENVESSVETENQTEETESQVAEKITKSERKMVYSSGIFRLRRAC